MHQSHMKKIAILFFLLIAATVFAQDLIIADKPPAPPNLYFIRDVEIQVEGITNARILRGKAAILPGIGFPDLASLKNYIADRKQRLVNERVLEKVQVDYVLEDFINDGVDSYHVDISVAVKDSWNIIALPYFRYDSNDGLLLSVRGRDYNFIGSMRALVLNLDYSQDATGRQSFGGYTTFGIPFLLFQHDSGINASQTINLYADGRPVTSLSNLSFWTQFKEAGFPITLEISQGLQFNPDQILSDIDPYFLRSALSVSTGVATGITLPALGAVSYNPSLTASINWRPDTVVRSDRQGLSLALSHGLSAGRIDWIENMRQGVSANLSNSVSYNIQTEALSTGIDASANYHATILGKIGLNTRLTGFYSLTSSVRTSLGSSMRGILSARLSGTEAAFLSLEMPVKLFDFPTHLLIKKNWFDFEMQMSPFLDLGYVGGGSGATLADKFWYGSGLEFFVYPLRMRTFIVRASLGFDLDALIRNRSFTEPSPRDGYSPYELYFGLGLFL